MDMGVRKLPKKRKFDPAELEENNIVSPPVCAPVSVVQSVSSSVPQATAVDYSRNVRVIEDTTPKKQSTIDLTEWCDHRVLAKQGDWYHHGVIREAINNDVSFYGSCVALKILFEAQ